MSVFGVSPSMTSRHRRRPSPAISILVLSLALVLPSLTSAAYSSQITPASFNDSLGNSVDVDSNIKYRQITQPSTGSSGCSKCVGDDGIRPFLNAAQHFVHLVGPADYPYDLIEKVNDGKLGEITDDYQKQIKDYMGLVICVAIGVLFIIIFPIIGLCFCCCRCCCENCGGNLKTDGQPKEGCARPCLILSMFILSCLVASGGVMMLFTSSSISDGLVSLHDDGPAKLDAMTEFLNESTKVIDSIATTDLKFARDVLFRDLDNIGQTFGAIVRDNMKNETKDVMNIISKSVDRLNTAFTSMREQLPRINSQIDHVKNNITAYVTVMTDVKNKFDSAMAGAGSVETAPDISDTIDPNELGKFDGTSEINNVGNLTEKLDNSLKEMDKIPEQVHNKSNQPVADLKSSITDYTSKVEDNTDDLDFADRLQTDDMKEKITEYTDELLKYDKYREYAGQGLGGIIILIAGFFVIGLLFGVCGSSGSTLPHERGCGSNCGSHFLMAAVAVSFIFGMFLMLLTTILFIVGAPVENFVCEALKDTSILDTLIDDYELLGKVSGSGTYLGQEILDDSDKNMTVTSILKSCKNNEAVYKAFRVNESSYFNITEILDYKSEFSVKDEISRVNIDWNGITILTPQLEADIKQFNSTIQYDFTNYNQELNRNATKPALDFKAELQRKRPSASGTVQPIYTAAIDSIQTNVDNEGKALQDSVAILEGQIDELKDTLHPPSEDAISQETGVLLTAMTHLSDNVIAMGNRAFQNAVMSFTDKIFGIVDAYIDHLLGALNDDIGKCFPIWDTYSSLFLENLCGTFVDSLNGFWFALGWSLFFLMPSIVIAVKLVSHFRTMRLDEGMEPIFGTEPKIELNSIPDAKGPNKFSSNKVAPYSSYSNNKGW